MNRIVAFNTFRKNIFLSLCFLQQPKFMHGSRKYSIENNVHRLEDILSSINGHSRLVKLDCESISDKRNRLLKKGKHVGFLRDFCFLMETFCDTHLKNFNLADLNMFDLLLKEADCDDLKVFDWILGVEDTPSEYQNSMLELLKNHAKELNIKPMKTTLFERLENLKHLKYTSDEDKEDANNKVKSACQTLYEVGLYKMTFTSEEQKQLGNLLADAFGAFKIYIQPTDFRKYESNNHDMKGAVLQFMMEDYGLFPARDSILIDELERMNINESLEIINECFLEVLDVWRDGEYPDTTTLLSIIGTGNTSKSITFLIRYPQWSD